MDVGKRQMRERQEQYQLRHDIIGTGDIAHALSELPPSGRLYFASGVSNSQETRESEYQREKDLLLQQPDSFHGRLVYFSSLATLYTYPDTRYTQHKKEMEQLVKDNFKRYSIVRIGNIDWGSNPHTLINFLKGQHERGEEMNIKDEYRYIVDKEEFLHWVNLIPVENSEMNITGKRMKVQEVVEEYVK